LGSPNVAEISHGLHATSTTDSVWLSILHSVLAGAPLPAGLSADEEHAHQQLAAFYKDVYYEFFMGTRPQTLTRNRHIPT
jgi:hypothetical protein